MHTRCINTSITEYGLLESHSHTLYVSASHIRILFYLEGLSGEGPLVVGERGGERRGVEVQVEVDQVAQQPLRAPVVLLRILHFQILAYWWVTKGNTVSHLSPHTRCSTYTCCRRAASG